MQASHALHQGFHTSYSAFIYTYIVYAFSVKCYIVNLLRSGRCIEDFCQIFSWLYLQYIYYHSLGSVRDIHGTR